MNSRINLAKPISGIYYDGRDDKSLVGVDIDVGGTIAYKTILQKGTHDTIIADPGHRYFDHVSPGKATDKAKEILDLIKDINANPVVIGSDGTPVNTGCHDGVNRLIELGLGKPCQHVICGLHFNELLLKMFYSVLMVHHLVQVVLKGLLEQQFKRILPTILSSRSNLYMV